MDNNEQIIEDDPTIQPVWKKPKEETKEPQTTTLAERIDQLLNEIRSHPEKRHSGLELGPHI